MKMLCHLCVGVDIFLCEMFIELQVVFCLAENLVGDEDIDLAPSEILLQLRADRGVQKRVLLRDSHVRVEIAVVDTLHLNREFQGFGCVFPASEAGHAFDHVLSAFVRVVTCHTPPPFLRLWDM